MPLNVNRPAHRTIVVKVAVLNEQGESVTEELNIKYQPITIAILEQWAEGKAKAEQSNNGKKWWIVDELASILIDADLVDSKGKPVKPTKAVLAELDIDIASAIHNAILGETFPNALP